MSYFSQPNIVPSLPNAQMTYMFTIETFESQLHRLYIFARFIEKVVDGLDVLKQVIEMT